MIRQSAGVIVAGAGIAGLMAALKLSPEPVTVLCKGQLGSGAATDWAQGGIAAAMGSDDSPRLHAIDTERAGAGISDEAIVAILTEDAPARIEDLLSLGTQFDRTSAGDLALGREAAHQRRRIVKAGGDATGHAILRTLIAAVRATPSVRIVEHMTCDDLAMGDNGICGVFAHDTRTGESAFFRAPSVIFATGGIGRLYRYTTNPVEATGDGVAMAARAGAMLADMEFVQFHPTALAIPRDPMPLVTEAVRGEGATLINDLGERFMAAIHPDAELAARDVVARAIFEQLQRGRSVGLDAREAIGDAFPERFPTVYASCVSAHIDPRVERIPVAPAAHYHMGGIAVDEWGRSSIGGLWACGEAGATGVHGANRLASNSLLEALVYASRVAKSVRASARVDSEPRNDHAAVVEPSRGETQAVIDLRNVMYANVGLVRSDAGLREALSRIRDLQTSFPHAANELRNLLVVAGLVTRAALGRRESRGSHYRADFPEPNDSLAKRSFTHLESVA